MTYTDVIKIVPNKSGKSIRLELSAEFSTEEQITALKQFIEENKKLLRRVTYEIQTNDNLSDEEENALWDKERHLNGYIQSAKMTLGKLEDINNHRSTNACEAKPIDNYCVIGLETTGTNRKYDEIIEICALRVRDNAVVDTFTHIVKPTIPISVSATKANGITNEMVDTAPTIKEVLPAFIEFVGNDTVIGHNIGSFDLDFIKRDCENEFNKPFNNKYIDTCLLARRTFSDMPNYKLSTLCDELGIIHSNNRAEADCISTKELYDKIKENN